MHKGTEQEKEHLKLVEQLSDMQKERIKAMQKLEVFLKDRRNLSAMLGVIDMAYPGLYDYIKKEYPSSSELEKKVLLLSRFKLLRTDEATLLGISTSVLDKVRGRVKKLKSLDSFGKSLDG